MGDSFEVKATMEETLLQILKKAVKADFLKSDSKTQRAYESSMDEQAVDYEITDLNRDAVIFRVGCLSYEVSIVELNNDE